MLKKYTINNKVGIYEEVKTKEELISFIEHEMEKSERMAIKIQSEELLDIFREFNEKDLEDVSFYWEVDNSELYIREF